MGWVENGVKFLNEACDFTSWNSSMGRWGAPHPVAYLLLQRSLWVYGISWERSWGPLWLRLWHEVSGNSVTHRMRMTGAWLNGHIGIWFWMEPGHWESGVLVLELQRAGRRVIEIHRTWKGDRHRALARLLELIYLKDPENSLGIRCSERVHEVGIPKDGELWSGWEFEARVPFEIAFIQTRPETLFSLR